MRHPFAIAIAAVSATVLAAAVRNDQRGLLFLALGILCFAVAEMLRPETASHIPPD